MASIGRECSRHALGGKLVVLGVKVHEIALIPET